MNPVSNASAALLEPTSPTAPPGQPGNSRDFLARQEADARLAMAAAAHDLKRDFVGALDPEAWVKCSPWATLGVAAAASFAVAAVVVPARRPAVPASAAGGATSPQEGSVPASTSRRTDGALRNALSAGFYGLARLALSEVINSAIRAEPPREPVPPPQETGVEPDMSM